MAACTRCTDLVKNLNGVASVLLELWLEAIYNCMFYTCQPSGSLEFAVCRYYWYRNKAIESTLCWEQIFNVGPCSLRICWVFKSVMPCAATSIRIEPSSGCSPWKSDWTSCISILSLLCLLLYVFFPLKEACMCCAAPSWASWSGASRSWSTSWFGANCS